jgi:acetyl-CoA acetyltransferase
MSDRGGAYVVDAVRTPIGRAGGALAGVRPDDLLAGGVESMSRAPWVLLKPCIGVGQGIAIVIENVGS